MGYEEALIAAGAYVHVYDSFGSYQGDWWAKVTYRGETGWVHGYYGSCSGCDAFGAEFGWNDPTDEQLASFGAQYLDGMLISQEEAEIAASENIGWDVDARKMVDFVKEWAEVAEPGEE